MKKAYFYIDDTIWVLRDITRDKKPSLFDNAFMNMLKTAHDKYGVKVQLNLFYRTDSFYGNDDFCLSDVTDIYKKEWEENADWLKLAFHAKEEFPDYPHVNATYEDTMAVFKNIEKEVFRFAGEKSFAYSVCPHWLPVSKDGVRALKDCGVKLLDCTTGDVQEYNGDPASLPYGHALRLLNNWQPETKVFTRVSKDEAITRSICCYNHFTTEEEKELEGTLKTVCNKEMDMQFKVYNSLCLNLETLNGLEEAFAKHLDCEYIGISDHEQYFYKNYLAYQPDYAEKIYKMGEILSKNGFKFVCGEELLN